MKQAEVVVVDDKIPKYFRPSNLIPQSHVLAQNWSYWQERSNTSFTEDLLKSYLNRKEIETAVSVHPYCAAIKLEICLKTKHIEAEQENENGARKTRGLLPPAYKM